MRILVAVGLGLGCITGLFLLFSKPAFDPGPLEETIEILEKKTARMRQGRFDYPLPSLERGRAEIAYLQKLADLLEGPQSNCLKAGQALERCYRDYIDGARGSVFGHAAYLYWRRRGSDFVHRTSQQIGDAPFKLTRRVRVEHEDPDKQFEVLKEKGDKIELATRAQAALRQAIENAATFMEECPEEIEELEEAMYYFLPGLKR